MATGQEGKLWIQNDCRPGDGYAQPGYFCPRHITWVTPLQPNQITGPNTEDNVFNRNNKILVCLV